VVWHSTFQGHTIPEFRTTNDGVDWDPSELLFPAGIPTDDYYDYDIAADGVGGWMVVMNRVNARNVVAGVSTDDAATFSKPIIVSPTGTRVFQRPTVSANDAGVFVVVFADIANDNDIYWRSTSNYGVSWSQNAVFDLRDSHECSYPIVEAHRNGTAWLVVYQRQVSTSTSSIKVITGSNIVPGNISGCNSTDPCGIGCPEQLNPCSKECGDPCGPTCPDINDPCSEVCGDPCKSGCPGFNNACHPICGDPCGPTCNTAGNCDCNPCAAGCPNAINACDPVCGKPCRVGTYL